MSIKSTGPVKLPRQRLARGKYAIMLVMILIMFIMGLAQSLAVSRHHLIWSSPETEMRCHGSDDKAAITTLACLTTSLANKPRRQLKSQTVLLMPPLHL